MKKIHYFFTCEKYEKHFWLNVLLQANNMNWNKSLQVWTHSVQNKQKHPGVVTDQKKQKIKRISFPPCQMPIIYNILEFTGETWAFKDIYHTKTLKSVQNMKKKSSISVQMHPPAFLNSNPRTDRPTGAASPHFFFLHFLVFLFYFWIFGVFFFKI